MDSSPTPTTCASSTSTASRTSSRTSDPSSWPHARWNSSRPARTSAMRRGLRAAASPAYLALLLVVVVGFVLRVENNSYGLPYVYNVDEGSHFTARAVGMLGGDWDPHYFQNPSAFTYLANFALRLRFGHVNPFGSFAKVIADFKGDPTAIYVTTRTVAALLGLVSILVAFWAGRRLWSAGAGVAAAAIGAFAFLPVTYSRIAVTD